MEIKVFPTGTTTLRFKFKLGFNQPVYSAGKFYDQFVVFVIYLLRMGIVAVFGRLLKKRYQVLFSPKSQISMLSTDCVLALFIGNNVVFLNRIFLHVQINYIRKEEVPTQTHPFKVCKMSVK